MALEMTLWRIEGSVLWELSATQLEKESRLEDWVFADPQVLGVELALVGRQVQTPFGGRVDLVGLNREGNCVVVELKRWRSPRDAVAQLLDYGSWVHGLGYAELEAICQSSRQQSLSDCFRQCFDKPVPETVNTSHSLLLVRESAMSVSGRHGYLCPLSAPAPTGSVRATS